LPRTWRRVIRQIAKRLLEIDAEIVEITVSDMAQLRKRHDDRLARSGNLLSEMAADVRSQIEEALARFERFSHVNELERLSRYQHGCSNCPPRETGAGPFGAAREAWLAEA
jgi:hypothetical protein